jgi:hypothetical protein
VATAEGSLAENEADLETAHDEIARLKREVRQEALGLWGFGGGVCVRGIGDGGWVRRGT